MCEMNDTRAPLIDVGRHIHDTPEALAPYTDLPWRRTVAEPMPNPPWALGGDLFPDLGVAREAAPPARTPDALIAHMDADGIDAGIVLPTALLKIGALPTAAYASALGRAYNRWLSAVWLGGSERVVGAVLAVPQDPADAAREIARHAGQRGVVGVCVPMGGVDPLWGDRCYDPIYAAAADAALPVILYGSADLVLPGTPGVPTVFTSRFEQHAMSQPLMAMAHLVSMTSTGVFARFPTLRVVFLEAGISWFTHLTLRMDKEYNENRRDIPFYTDRVSTYLRRQVWLGTHPCEPSRSPGDLAAIIGLSGDATHILYGSHWPFPDRDAPGPVAAAFPDIAMRAEIMGSNAAALFGIAADRGTVRAQ